MVPPRAAYVHVPFCRRRCGYCDFTVVAGRDGLQDEYLNALEVEIRSLRFPRPVDSLYVGGGTPTHLTPARLSRLLTLLAHWFPLDRQGEWSVEANPADLDGEKMRVLQSYGVNRISLGAQSFSARKLRVLERDHGAQDVRRAFSSAREHFPSVAMDLMFAVPGESLDEWRQDLAAAIALRPDHLSTYGLTFEKGALFWGRRQRDLLTPVDDNTQRAMYETAIDRLTADGWEHYEISNFARPGHRCRHNEVYWRGDHYFGVGPGAARYVDGCRQTNHRSTSTYVRRLLAGQSPVAESERLAPADRAREQLVFRMRMLEGVLRSEFAERTGFDVDELVGESLRKFTRLGLLEDHLGRIRLTREGLLLSDTIWPEWL